ncbi:MAG: hypothetical protein MUE69_16960 [Myxococcota bacterium]|nr:hypothetical protein [Myxococcota bacterium]
MQRPFRDRPGLSRSRARLVVATLVGLFACTSTTSHESTLPAPAPPEPVATELSPDGSGGSNERPDEEGLVSEVRTATVAIARTATGLELTLEGAGTEACLGTTCAPLTPRARFEVPRLPDAVAPGSAWIAPLAIDGALVDPLVVALDPGIALSALPERRLLSDVRAALLAPFAATRVVTAGALHVHLGAADEASLDRLETSLSAASAAAFARFGELAGPIAIAWSPARAAASATSEPSATPTQSAQTAPVVGVRWTLLTRATLPSSAADLPSMLETIAASVAHPREASAEVPRWLRRGMGRYGAWLLAADLRRAAPNDALHVLARAYERHRAAAQRRPISDGDDADGGALALFCTDLALRRSGSNLAEVLAPSPERFVDRLTDTHPELARTLAARVTFRGVIDLDGCARPFGLRLVALRTNRLGPESRAQLFEGALVEGLVVRRAPAEGRLRTGDVLVRLGEVPIFADEDVDLALVGLEPGHRIASTWARGERLVRVSLPVPFGPTALGVRFVLEADEGALGVGFPFTVGPRAR